MTRTPHDHRLQMATGYRRLHTAPGPVLDPAGQLALKKLRLVAFWHGGKEHAQPPVKTTNTPAFQPHTSVRPGFLHILQPKQHIPADTKHKLTAAFIKVNLKEIYKSLKQYYSFFLVLKNAFIKYINTYFSCQHNILNVGHYSPSNILMPSILISYTVMMALTHINKGCFGSPVV